MSNVMGTLVTIHPTEKAHYQAIAKFGYWFWERETISGVTRLIPVKDGIPYVADFIFVPTAQVQRETANQQHRTYPDSSRSR